MAKWGEIKCPRCATLEERLEAAQRDAKEAEAYAEELEANLQEQIEWVKSLADDLIAAEGREARLKDKLAKAVEALEFYAEADNYEDQHKPESCGCCYYLHDAEIKEVEGAKARTTLAELTGGKDEWKCPINYTGCTKNCGSYGCGN